MRYVLSLSMREEAGISIIQRIERFRNSREVPEHWCTSSNDTFVQQYFNIRLLEKMKSENIISIIERCSAILNKLELEGRTAFVVDITWIKSGILDTMIDYKLVPISVAGPSS